MFRVAQQSRFYQRYRYQEANFQRLFLERNARTRGARASQLLCDAGGEFGNSGPCSAADCVSPDKTGSVEPAPLGVVCRIKRIALIN